ncbi:hypothetical protein E4U17_000218 [Claviceps sp. LM77 group G4]|nr:hypothetical protein E4U17_000218 [Claviceps sp. LM77 group G4]KAG6078516.1 hypothetical protein E4U16_001585 [Claviceps sp. LM84 group G4]
MRYISAESLAGKILAEEVSSDPSYAIIDVRDGDYIGGHIKGCINIPTLQLDLRMPRLVEELKHKRMVVFHCALSQQRGPTAAMKYSQVREALLKKQGPEGPGLPDQEVVVLQGGFSGWQKVYGNDVRLTEGYVKAIWDNF